MEEDVTFSKLLREKGAGVLQNYKKGSFKKFALRAGVPLREYKPKGGESNDEMNNRVGKFLRRLVGEGFRGQIQNILDDPKTMKKVLIVSHGGWIMEFFNYVDWVMKGIKPGLKNVIKNCSLNVVRIYCEKTGAACVTCEGCESCQKCVECDPYLGCPKCKNCEACKGDDCILFDVVRKNDIKHIVDWKNQELEEKRQAGELGELSARKGRWNAEGGLPGVRLAVDTRKKMVV